MINQAGVNVVKRFEGLRLTAYPDPASGGAPWTIGYGHTGADVSRGKLITEIEATQLLLDDLLVAENVVIRAVVAPLTDNQFAALASFVFNVGAGRAGVKDGFVVLKTGKPSTLLRKLNGGDYQGAADEFLKWAMPGSAVHAGLLARRTAERALFLTPDIDSQEGDQS